MRYRKPTAEEISALQTFARICGPRWKVTLRECWMNDMLRVYLNSNDAALVRALRNTHGPSWLNRFKLPISAA